MLKKIFLLNTFRCALTSDKRFRIIRSLNTLAAMKNCYLQRACCISPEPKHVNIFQDVQFRYIATSGVHFEDENDNEEPKKPVKKIDPAKDRSKIIPLEVSLRYMKSKAYQTTYAGNPVWLRYRRNHKGLFPPRLTRMRCIRGGVIITGSPCPICRDEYLIIHYTNVDLLKQFISPYTGEVLQTNKTNVCRKRQMDLEVAIEKAKYYGLITFEVPFRVYDYAEFYPQLRNTKSVS